MRYCEKKIIIIMQQMPRYFFVKDFLGILICREKREMVRLLTWRVKKNEKGLFIRKQVYKKRAIYERRTSAKVIRCTRARLLLRFKFLSAYCHSQNNTVNEVTEADFLTYIIFNKIIFTPAFFKCLPRKKNFKI